MVRILHFGLSSSLGGIETYLKKITTHINKDKFQFDFLVMGNEKPCWHDEFLHMGSRFYKITKRSKNPLKSNKELKKLFEKEKFDIVHCHLNSLSNISPVLMALKYNNRVIVHSRNANTPRLHKNKLLHSINILRLPKRKIVMFAVSDKAGKWMFGNKSNYTVINNGIDVEDFKYNHQSRINMRQNLNIEDHFSIINVGALRYQKNHLFILEVFKDLLKFKPKSKLLLVGTGHLEQEIRDKAIDLGINEKILMLGNRNDISSLLSASDAFLFPSFYEGFPNALLEAQTSGLPALYSDTITREVIVNYNCQTYSLNKSSKDWAEKLLLLENFDDRKKGAEQVERNGFSVEEEIKKLEGLYTNILNN
ncbi:MULTISPECIES: glycosyltransferase [unclassified Oceanobacillus]|uniref:glycosyltransferase n=1 Tax=unclassified Oceanobacillus TaxID=2630292 RepID=UPI00300DCFAA